MSEILGKLEKPEAEQFKTGRKLYLAPLVFVRKDSPEEYVEKVEQYWKQVGEHLANIEGKIGKIKKIYHESNSFSGEQGLSNIQQINKKAYPLIKEKCDQGAEMQAIEDLELFTQSLDWGNCLRVVMTQTAFEKISEFFWDISTKRFNHIAQRIDETLGENEAGVLFISEGHSVQFSSSIQIFYVSPPILDEIRRWFREKAKEEDFANQDS
ncbi:MAG: hypothetical protein WC364_02315 [Eubacteriales bacterium]